MTDVFFLPLCSSRQKIETLNSEIAILKDDLEESKNTLKQKDEEIRSCKEQVDFWFSPLFYSKGQFVGKRSEILLRWWLYWQ